MSRVSAAVVGACLALAGGLTTTFIASNVGAAPPDSAPPDDSPSSDSDPESPDTTDGAGDVPAAPPISPGIGRGTTEFERQLAEISFASFVAIELELDAGNYACTEPRSVQPPAAIQCFTIIDGTRIVVAETEASNGTGRFVFNVISNDTVAELTEADEAVLSRGDEINQAADEFQSQYLAADPRITTIGTFHFDPESMVLTLDITLADDVGFTPDVVAWVNTREFARAHWTSDSPFRTEGAMLRPGFTMIVNGNEFVSDFSLMVKVAEEDIGQEAWLDIAER